jgi:hypothetical protein
MNYFPIFIMNLFCMITTMYENFTIVLRAHVKAPQYINLIFNDIYKTFNT